MSDRIKAMVPELAAQLGMDIELESQQWAAPVLEQALLDAAEIALTDIHKEAYAEPIVALTPDDAAKVRAIIAERDRFEYLWNLESARATKAESEGFFDRMKMVRYRMALESIASNPCLSPEGNAETAREALAEPAGDNLDSHNGDKK